MAGLKHQPPSTTMGKLICANKYCIYKKFDGSTDEEWTLSKAIISQLFLMIYLAINFAARVYMNVIQQGFEP